MHYIGIPHEPGASSMEAADCWGLLRLAYNNHSGRELPPYGGPAWRSWASGRQVADVGEAALAYSEQFLPVIPGQERLFDGVLFRMRGFPIHVGLVVHPGWMLHVQQGADSTVERYRDAALWTRRIVGFFRHV